ncbi:hypothetical protein MMC26_000348 [Xylographa opegraphella]|nr:hypothetical protein [Xylographa opegraphella]
MSAGSSPSADSTDAPKSPGKPRLTEEEKKQNHIASEQKRRAAIRAQFDRLAELTPGMAGLGRSEGVVLSKVVEFAREQVQERKKLIAEIEKKGGVAIASKRDYETSQAEDNALSLISSYTPETEIEKYLAKRVEMLDIKSALSNDCIESKALTFRLDEELPKTFDHFVYWLYTQQVVPKGESLEEMTWISLAQLYVLADRRTCLALKNDVMDSLVTKVVKGNGTINLDTIVYIWKNTLASSKLRQFAIDCQAYCGQLAEFAECPKNRSKLPVDYVFELLKKYYQLTEKRYNPIAAFEKPGFGKYYHELVKYPDW